VSVKVIRENWWCGSLFFDKFTHYSSRFHPPQRVFLVVWRENMYFEKFVVTNFNLQVFRELHHVLFMKLIRPREEVFPKTGYSEFSVTCSKV